MFTPNRLRFHYENLLRQDMLLKLNYAKIMEIHRSFKEIQRQRTIRKLQRQTCRGHFVVSSKCELPCAIQGITELPTMFFHMLHR